jgi:hypothetical protein
VHFMEKEGSLLQSAPLSLSNQYWKKIIHRNLPHISSHTTQFLKLKDPERMRFLQPNDRRLKVTQKNSRS